MTVVAALIEQARSLGATLEVHGGGVKVKAPKPLPLALLEDLRRHKADVLLHLAGYHLKYPDNQDAEQELKEIAERVRSVGYVLLWSRVLQDLVAFYRDEESKRKIPPGFVPYSDYELRELFGEGKPPPSPDDLRLIHEAKKLGAMIPPSQDDG